jgi:putative spermidine/putrescine transport system substrate-binding protein
MNRRRYLTSAVIVVAGTLILAGCAPAKSQGNGQATSPNAQAAVAGKVTPASFAGKQFSYSGYGGTSQEAQDATLADFAEITGAQYAADGPPDLAKIKAQVDSGNVMWDLISLSDVLANDPSLCGVLFEKIDQKKVDVSKLPDSAPVTDCGVPMNANGWSFAYNTKAFAGAKDLSWSTFFDTKKYPGKRAIYSGIPQIQLEIGLLGDGVAVDNLYPLDVERSLAKFDSIKKDLLFYTTGSESQQMMESDQIVACICWSGRAFTIIDNGAPWALSTQAPPQLRIDYWAIPKGAKNLDLSYAAINYSLGEKQQSFWQKETAYPSMNKDVAVELSPAAEAVNVLDKRFNANRVDIDYWVKNQSDLTDRWTKWITG